MTLSIVRRNLLTRPGYTPYCGHVACRFNMPRTTFRDGQFECMCGWRSAFEPQFIAEYVSNQTAMTAGALTTR